MVARIYTNLLWIPTFFCFVAKSQAANRSVYRVPDEQRLYRELMWGYENSVRPVINANSTILVKFRLTLNQIIDLDERKQVLTTNVFIDQSWTDENLMWNPADYNNIKTLRVHESLVWLPDTFLFNNADEGSTGFMRGMYVLLNYNGTVLWPVPVKLKSSCKVDIAYFPFDDQRCQWRFGSWIYSGSWIDFDSSRDEIDLLNFIDNSEWELLTIHFQKNYQLHASVDDSHPDLLFTLHIRRRTLFYIFNIIAPCVMLSVLTLLTFWLPTTSGEKISLGLSVFLAFSMFMLLIAEEVPATSNSVPLIGVYLTTVMTMTSVSVIMAVMVINLYNRGSKAVHAPKWVRVLVLEGLSRMLGLKHDIDKLTDNIKLDKDEEAKYACMAHPPVLSRRSKFRRMSRSPCPSPPRSPFEIPPPAVAMTAAVCSVAQSDFKVKVTPQSKVPVACSLSNGTSKNNGKCLGNYDHCCSSPDCCTARPLTSKTSNKENNNNIHRNNQFVNKRKKNIRSLNVNGSFNVNNRGMRNRLNEKQMKSTVIPLITITGTEEMERSQRQEVEIPESPIWKKRDSVLRRQRQQEAGGNREEIENLLEDSKGRSEKESQEVLDSEYTVGGYKVNNNIINTRIQNGGADVYNTCISGGGCTTTTSVKNKETAFNNGFAGVGDSSSSGSSGNGMQPATRVKSIRTDTCSDTKLADESNRKLNSDEGLKRSRPSNALGSNNRIKTKKGIPMECSSESSRRTIANGNSCEDSINQGSTSGKVKAIPVTSVANDKTSCVQLQSNDKLCTDNNQSSDPSNSLTPEPIKKKAIPLKVADVLGTDETPCQKKAALLERRQIVVEWQTIATVVDRLLFWLFLVGTVVAYLVILFLIPYTKPGFNEDDNNSLLHVLQRSKRHDLVMANTV